MRIILIVLLHVTLFAQSYNFDEVKFVSAIETDFRQSGKIEIEKNSTIITYTKPQFKLINKTDNNITITNSSGEIYALRGKALFYTNLFIGVMTRLGDIKEIKTNRDFDVQKDNDIYNITFKGDIADSILKAEVKTKEAKVISFKMFMPNDDTLTIIKK